MHHTPTAPAEKAPAATTTADRLDCIAARVELLRAGLSVVIRQMPRHELPCVFDMAAAVQHLQHAFAALEKAADHLDDVHAPIGYTLT